MNKILQNILFGVFIISLMSLIFLSFEKKRDDIKSNFNNSEINTNVPLSQSDSNVWSTLRSWNDFEKIYYSDYFKVRLDDFYAVESLKERSNAETLAAIYRQLSEYDSPDLDLIYSTFSNIQNFRKLDRASFANVLVSFVQSIKYAYVFEYSCSEMYSTDPEVRKSMDGGTLCDGNNNWGLNSPIEFMKTLKGDCDTRTLFLYTIMKKFLYDVIILNSDTHSMLGVNLPSSGTYISHRGKRYFMWETTAKNWQMGDMPPNSSGDSWEIIP